MQLDTQYRMHPSIVDWPNQRFYHSSLKGAAHTKNMRTIKGSPWPCSGVRLVFVTVEGEEEESGISFCNQAEASMVQIIVDSVLRADENVAEIQQTSAS